MRTYRLLWHWGWGTTTGLAAGAGLLLGDVEIPLFLAALATCVTVTMSLALGMHVHPARLRHSTGEGTRAATTLGIKVGVVVGAVAASVNIVGALVVPLTMVAALTSPHFNALLNPPGRRHGPGWAGHDSTDDAGLRVEITAESLRAAVETLDDAELCRGWRCSRVALDRTRGPGARLEMVNLRQAYLDEIERRHPAGFHAWLTSGVRPASDPTPFLRPGHAHRGESSKGPRASSDEVDRGDDIGS